MIELLFALLIGMFFGYLAKKNRPINLELYNKVDELEKDLLYYKDLCKWHTQRKNEFFEEGRQQGMKQERALWELAASTQESELLDTGSYLIGRYDSAKTLTDEEIWELSDMVLNNSDVIGFARAILRKAQEQ